MPAVSLDVRITRTGWGLIVRVVWGTAFCFVLAGAATAAGGTFWVFLVISWLSVVALELALHRARLTTTGEVLTYRGPLCTRTWQREEIASFWIDTAWWIAGTTRAHIGMETVAGEQVNFWLIYASLLFNRELLDRWLASLLDWLEAADQPQLD